MSYRTLAAHLQLFIDNQTNISSAWNGDESGQAEDDAHTADDLVKLAQPLLDELRELIADEDFVPPTK